MHEPSLWLSATPPCPAPPGLYLPLTSCLVCFSPLEMKR